MINLTRAAWYPFVTTQRPGSDSCAFIRLNFGAGRTIGRSVKTVGIIFLFSEVKLTFLIPFQPTRSEKFLSHRLGKLVSECASLDGARQGNRPYKRRKGSIRRVNVPWRTR